MINIINSIFRFLNLIPLGTIFICLLRSYWIKRNTINGLRPTRTALTILIFALIFSNIYFFFFSVFRLSRASITNQYIVYAEKIVSLVAYWLMYWLFKSHKPDDMAIEDNRNIKIIKKDVKKIKGGEKYVE
jgi:hypothetical protein